MYGLKYLPIFMALSAISMPFILIAIASRHSDFELLLPYVSDLGIISPEASLFTLFMFLSSFGVFVFSCIRFDLDRSLISERESRLFKRVWNRATYLRCSNVSVYKSNIKCSLVTGIVLSLLLALIGSFRNAEHKLVFVIHNIAASLMFQTMMFDIYFQIRVSTLQKFKSIASKRTLLLVISQLGYLVSFVYGVLSWVKNRKYAENSELRLRWSAQNAGYFEHVMSTAFEWIIILMFAPYFLSFGRLFKKIRPTWTQTIRPTTSI